MQQKILVIDDDAAVRGAFQLVLSEMGCTVSLAENGLQGIELAQAERPDLIFLDLKMSGIDGVETMRRLLAMDRTLNIYIVTAFSREYLDELQRAQAEGMVFQLANKPLSSSQIRHIARSAHSLTATGEEARKITLTLYVVSIDPETRKLLNQLSTVLAEIYQPGYWTLNLVEVLSLPEKALEKEVFATPMLVREVPQPVLKLLGDLSKIHSVLAAITAQNGNGSGTVIMKPAYKNFNHHSPVTVIDTSADCELILNIITDGMLVVDSHGIVLYANRSAEQLFERGDLSGTHLAVPLNFDTAFQEINLIRRSGIGWAELRSGPIRWAGQAAFAIGVRDITARKQAEVELRIAAAAFDSQVGMMIADANVRILKVNQAFTAITGYSNAEVQGKSPNILSSGMHGANFYVAMWESINRTGVWDGEIWNRRKNGEIYPEHLTITAVKDPHGKVTNYVGALTDSTQRQQTLQELRSTASKLEQANAQIEEERAMLAERVKERTAELLLANKAKDSFLATMSHEIRTPLGGLLGMMGLLELSQLDDKQRELLHAARNSGNGLLRIVNDILDWSKIEAGKLELAAHAASILNRPEINNE